MSVTTVPGPSARVDDGQKLMPPQEKKGGPIPPRHPDALKAERERAEARIALAEAERMYGSYPVPKTEPIVPIKPPVTKRPPPIW